jgi:hypothetical protein
MISSRSFLYVFCIVVVIQSTTCFIGPSIASRDVAASFAMARFHPGSEGEFPAKSKRGMIFEGIKQAPKRSKRFLAFLVTSIALWRGPNLQPAVAARKPTTQRVSARKSDTKESSSSRTRNMVLTGSGSVLVFAGGWKGTKLARRSKNDGDTNDETTIDLAESESLDLNQLVTEDEKQEVDVVVEGYAAIVKEGKVNLASDSTQTSYCEEEGESGKFISN